MSPRRRSCASMPTSPTSGASRASPPGCCGSPVTSSKEDVDELRDPDLASAGEGILATGLGNDPQQNLLRRELATHMTQALAQLPEKHRAILVLREVEGLSYEELAERLEIPTGTVMSRLFHARTKMQALLRKYVGVRPAPDDEASASAERAGTRRRGDS